MLVGQTNYNIDVSTVGCALVPLMQSSLGDFIKSPVGAVSLGRKSEMSPDESEAKDRAEFEGHSIVVYREFQSGARRITIDVDGRGSAVV
jgi:hypothetical protein